MNTKYPFGFKIPEASPGFLLWQTTMTWQRLIKKALEPHDISHAQFVIMATLIWFELQKKSPTQVLIVNWTKLDKMTVSKSIKKLVTSKLVNRIEHQTDTRAKNVSLTAKGRALIHQLIPLVEQVDAEFFGKGISNKDQSLLLQILKKLLA
ncbi:MAG: MarR family winged helix-turn-helix transcriptional regulator [Chthoniobacterales bacterium]|nr:MarR family winged helix-turn-helix transcriptional regulator [Chthoniobacterales bacterium]